MEEPSLAGVRAARSSIGSRQRAALTATVVAEWLEGPEETGREPLA